MDAENKQSFEKRSNKVIAILIALVTVVIAVITYMQNDSAMRDDRANRDQKRYSLEAMSARITGDAQVNFDYYRVYTLYKELDLLARSATEKGEKYTADRYIKLRDRMKANSKLLAPPYMNEKDGTLELDKYEVDTFIQNATALNERFTAASDVKDIWDNKSNTYIIHLTLLAVSLFLFGMATTIASRFARILFSIVGSVVALIAVGWAVSTYLKPVIDFRDYKTKNGVAVIDRFADGVGLAYQGKNEEAVAAFDEAISFAPNYTNAFYEKGNSLMGLGRFKDASVAYESAIKLGKDDALTLGNLGWAYYKSGQFEDSIKNYQSALNKGKIELWMQFDLAMNYLSTGNIEKAKKMYDDTIQMAANEVEKAAKEGREPPSDMWWSLDDAAGGLELLDGIITEGKGDPDPKLLKNPQEIQKVGQEIFKKLRSASVSLEYDQKLPQGELQAKISPLRFYEPKYDNQGEQLDVEDFNDVFPKGIIEVAVQFDYEKMKNDQEMVIKVYVNGSEENSWRQVIKWDMGESGTAEKTLSFSYSTTSALTPGEYTVEVYVDGHLAQSGAFIVEE